MKRYAVRKMRHRRPRSVTHSIRNKRSRTKRVVRSRRPVRPRFVRKVRSKQRVGNKTRLHQVPIPDLSVAYESGAAAGAEALQAGLPENKIHRRELFRSALNNWFNSETSKGRPSYAAALQLGNAFLNGYTTSIGDHSGQYGVPVPLSGDASVVITACNEEKTIGSLIDELGRLPLKEMIVVLNGCTDGSLSKVRNRANVITAFYPQRLGHDIGRSIGAALASGASLLFVDGDMTLPAEELAAFLYEQEKGLDVVLNDISGYIPPYERQDEVTRCKLFLNQALGRPDLKCNSMTAVPHVLSRKAIETIGTAILAVPPKAQAAAVIEGLAVSAPCSADVIGRNRLRDGNAGAGNSVLRLIVGDHVEALNEALRRKGKRLSWETEPRPQLAKVRNGR